MARARRSKSDEDKDSKGRKGSRKKSDQSEANGNVADGADTEVATIDEETHEKYEKIKKGDLHISELQKLNVSELHDIAKEEGLTEYVSMKKQDLIFNILKSRITKTG